MAKKNLTAKLEQILGSSLTDAQSREILEIGSALEITDSDALWGLVGLYYKSQKEQDGRFKQRVEAAQAELQSIQAAGQATVAEIGMAQRQATIDIQSELVATVQAMVPTVSKQLNKSVAKAVRDANYGKSYISVWVGALITSVIFFLGFIVGSRFYEFWSANRKNGNLYWDKIGFGVYISLGCPALLLMSCWLVETSDYENRRMVPGVLLMAAAMLVFAIPGSKILGFIP